MLAKTPVTIVTGFLGAGKTTLIRHLVIAERGVDREAVALALGA
jgi:cobalamin biosynthesis protein CobW